MGNKRVSPDHNGYQHWAIGKCKNHWEQAAKFPWRPNVDQGEKRCEVAEIAEEVMPLVASVSVPAIAQQCYAFLEEEMVNEEE